MKKNTKWVLFGVALFVVLFGIGFTKSVLEEQRQVTFAEGKMGVIQPEMMPAPTEIAVDYAKGYQPRYYDEHYGSGEDIEVDLKIIRTSYLRLEVDDFFLASQKVEAYASKYGGYVSNSDARADDDNRKSGTVTIRVPDIHFDAVLAELSLLGDVQSKTTTGQDVTEEFIDLNARINNSKAHEARLLKMYETAEDVNEMMQVERELSRVREQIETMEGRLRYLNNRVDMSTITVYLYEPAPVVKQWGIWESIKKALNHSLRTLRWMIELIGVLLPLIVVGVLVGLLIRWRRRKKLALRRK